MRGTPKGDLKKIQAAAAKRGVVIGGLADIADDVVAISTGNIAIDAATGVGGVPLGRSLELFGFPSCGKTTTALQTAANLQKIIKAGGDPAREIGPDDKILYLDYEHALAPDYAFALGLDTQDEDTFWFSQPDTLEDGMNYAIELIETGKIRLLIIDSIASMMPSAKAEAELGKSLPAVQAKLVTDMTQKLSPILHNYNCAAIYLNQLKELMDMGGRRPGMPVRTDTPGGKGLKYYSSVRMQYSKLKDNKESVVDPLTRIESDRVTSTDVVVRVVKNKVGPPFRQAIVRVRDGRGFDNFWTAMQILVAHKKVMVTGAYHYFHNIEAEGLAPEWMQRAATGVHRPFIQGQAALFRAADEHPEWRAGIIRAAEAVSASVGWQAVGTVGAPEPEEDPDSPDDPDDAKAKTAELL